MVSTFLQRYFCTFANRDADGMESCYVEKDIKVHVYPIAIPIVLPKLSFLANFPCLPCLPVIDKIVQPKEFSQQAVASLPPNYAYAGFKRLRVAKTGGGFIAHYALSRYSADGKQILDGGFVVYKIIVKPTGDLKISDSYMCGLSEDVPQVFKTELGWDQLSFTEASAAEVFCKP